jgi:hypothetical protein
MERYLEFSRNLLVCCAGYFLGALLFSLGYIAYYRFVDWSIFVVLLFWVPVVTFWVAVAVSLRLWRPAYISAVVLFIYGFAIAFLPLLGFWPTYFFRLDIALYIFAVDAVFLGGIVFLCYFAVRWAQRMGLTSRSSQPLTRP